MQDGLRLMVYDRTCGGTGPLPGLTTTWRVGGWLYGQLGRLDAWYGATTWEDALDWVATFEAGRPVAELQYWGHGNWGTLLLDRVRLDAAALSPEDPRHPLLSRIRDRLLPNGRSLLWFRTCETFGTPAGHRFAQAFADFFQATVAGHTYVIAWAQSGLHTLRPGESPDWSEEEGLPEASPEPKRALWSGFTKPNTISCLHGTIPKGF